MKSSWRRPMVMLLGAAVAASVLTMPAQGAAEPTTLEIEGTLKVVVIDTLGAGAHADHLYTVVTDDGAEIPVDLDEETAANGRFQGEVIVSGGVASALRSKDLLPRAGSTIEEDTRAGRVAIAAAEDQTKPLTVASSTVEPAIAAAVTAPSAHRAYVARMTNQGSVDGTDAEIRTKIDGMLDYWETESGGAITDFRVTGVGDPADPIKEFVSTANVPVTQNCGIGTYAGSNSIWADAAQKFPGINFALPGNHLIVLVGEECITPTGPVGIAEVGSSINDGGPSIVIFEPTSFRTTGVHEIGHNFGLMHANLAECPSADICEYFDFYSPMSLSLIGQTFTPPALGTIHRAQLGLLAPGEMGTISLAWGQLSFAQAFSLAPRGSAAGQRGLAVRDPYTGVVYSIDWRNRTVRDVGTFYGSASAFVPPAPLYPAGIVVERQSSTGQTYLITHAAGGRAQGAFQPGETFAPSAGLAVTVNSIGPAATVTVRLTAPPKRFSTKTPKITGTARVGKTLKVKVGSWSPRPSYRYQWYANGKKITKKGTKSSFKLTSKQKGKRITVRVTGTKSGYVTVTKPSKATKKVAKRK